jgi:hypothetical protein
MVGERYSAQPPLGDADGNLEPLAARALLVMAHDLLPRDRRGVVLGLVDSGPARRSHPPVQSSRGARSKYGPRQHFKPWRRPDIGPAGAERGHCDAAVAQELPAPQSILFRFLSPLGSSSTPFYFARSSTPFAQHRDDAGPPPLSLRRSVIGVSARIGSGAITEEGDLISAPYVMKPKTSTNPFGRSVKTWLLRRNGYAKGLSVGNRHVSTLYNHLFSINP